MNPLTKCDCASVIANHNYSGTTFATTLISAKTTHWSSGRIQVMWKYQIEMCVRVCSCVCVCIFSTQKLHRMRIFNNKIPQISFIQFAILSDEPLFPMIQNDNSFHGRQACVPVHLLYLSVCVTCANSYEELLCCEKQHTHTKESTTSKQ